MRYKNTRIGVYNRLKTEVKLKETTIKIDPARREALKDAAFDIQYEIRENVTMSDVVRHLIDKHLKEAIEEMKKCNDRGKPR